MLIRLVVLASLLSASLAGAAPRKKKSPPPPPPAQVAPAPEEQPEPLPPPAEKPAEPAAAPAQEKPGPRYLKLASPGFSVVNVEPEIGTFLSDHFAQQLALGGIKVATATEIRALVGLERQRQLIGCGDDASSCMAELVDALGADGLITGSIASFGNTFQINIKIVSALDGAALSVLSRNAKDEENALTVLTEAAAELAPSLLAKTGREPASVVAQAEAPVFKPRNTVTISPGFIMGFYGIEYERVLYPWITLFIAPTFVGSSMMLPNNSEWSRSFEVVVGGRVFLGENAPKGFFGSAQVGLGYGSTRFKETGLATGPGVMPGVTVGYTFLFFGGRVPISLGGGLGYGMGTYLQGSTLLLVRMSSGLAF